MHQLHPLLAGLRLPGSGLGRRLAAEACRDQGEDGFS